MSEYIMNKETGKLELHFEKEDYLKLDESLKKEIKSNFLFSRKAGAWVSRAKFPNLWRAEEVAKKIGLENGGKVGETLSFREQMERKADRAEQRAERYDYKSSVAEKAGEELQKPINDMHGDISFFTQPNINTSAGRAFTRKRDRMFAAYEKGFEEFKKSGYYAERAEAARQTAAQTKPTDKGFIDRRIKDAEKTIRAQKKNLEAYERYLEKIQSGQEIKRYNGEIITEEEVLGWIENAEEIIDQAISKSVYYHECLEDLGGVVFSKENIKPGYIVRIKRWGDCKVLSTGKVNITYEIVNGGAAGCTLKGAYAEIEKIVSDEVADTIEHPFQVGDKFKVKQWNGEQYADKEYTVTKITPEKVSLKSGKDRAISRKPRKFRNAEGICWALDICDGLHGTVYKRSAS